MVSWKLLLLCLICVPFVVLASIKFQRDSNKAYLDVRDGIGNTLSQLQEGIAGVRVVQAFGREDVEAERFQHGNQRLFDAHMRSVKISAWYLPVIEFAGLFTTAIAVGVGGYWVYTGDLTIGTVTFFVLTLSNLFEPIQQLSQLFNIVQSAGAALNKLFELLDTAGRRARAGGRGRPARARRHRGRPASASPTPAARRCCSDVDLAHRRRRAPGARRPHRRRQVHPRQAHRPPLRPHRGLPCASPASTCATPPSGRCASGSSSCPRRASCSTARSSRTSAWPAPAPPTTRCWPRSTPSASASASPLLPEGLDTEVRERGSRLSAGEKQLVSLARAALADPAVLVLDEATSSLDPGTEVVVEQAMTRLMEGRTVIVIAHRLSTAERADVVGVVADGRLLELGTHDELVAQGDRYAALFATWSGGLAHRLTSDLGIGEVSAGRRDCYHRRRRNSLATLTEGSPDGCPRTSTSRSTSSAGATPRTTSSSPRRA